MLPGGRLPLVRDGAVARVVTNIPRLLVRVVETESEGSEESSETEVLLPGEARPVTIGRQAVEYDPTFLDLIRVHAPRRST